jgi:hypothetical protein
MGPATRDAHARARPSCTAGMGATHARGRAIRASGGNSGHARRRAGSGIRAGPSSPAHTTRRARRASRSRSAHATGGPEANEAVAGAAGRPTPAGRRLPV